MSPVDVATGSDVLWQDLIRGDRRTLARSISLCESSRADHRRLAAELVARACEHPRVETTMRIGITGPAGVGKSTLLDVLGEHLITRGDRPAVLAVDPSSRLRGGSLLGDQARMVSLVRKGAFVRPSPTRGHLGGVGPRTLEAALLVAAAGFGPIFIETVGVGQNETEVSDWVDAVVLLLQPGAGDELQGMKRGLIEHADIIAVAQADGARLALAEETQSRFDAALRLLGRQERPPVALVSAHARSGIVELWQAIEEHGARQRASGRWAARRNHGKLHWFQNDLVSEVVELLRAPGALGALLLELEKDVASGQRTVPEAIGVALGELRQRMGC